MALRLSAMSSQASEPAVYSDICMALVYFPGLTALLLSIIPLVAIVPVLLFIGLVIGAQAFQVSPKRHAPAIVLAPVPKIAEWVKTQVDGALSAAGVNPVTVSSSKKPILSEPTPLSRAFCQKTGFSFAAVHVFTLKNNQLWNTVNSLWDRF